MLPNLRVFLQEHWEAYGAGSLCLVENIFFFPGMCIPGELLGHFLSGTPNRTKSKAHLPACSNSSRTVISARHTFQVQGNVENSEIPRAETFEVPDVMSRPRVRKRPALWGHCRTQEEAVPSPRLRPPKTFFSCHLIQPTTRATSGGQIPWALFLQHGAEWPETFTSLSVWGRCGKSPPISVLNALQELTPLKHYIYEGRPQNPEFIYKTLCIYSYMFKLQSSPKSPPFDAIQRTFFHCSKQFLNSSILMPFGASVVFHFPSSTMAKCFPLRNFFSSKILGKQTKVSRPRSGE